MGTTDLAKTRSRPAPEATTSSTDKISSRDAADKSEATLDTTPAPTERLSGEDAVPVVVAEKPAATGTSTDEAAPENAGIEYIAGWKLISVMFAVTMACFLMLLDMSILATVSLGLVADSSLGVVLVIVADGN